MPFETKCQGCNRQLRVADEHAGKKARCPHCGMIFDVPPAMGPVLDVPSDFGRPAQPNQPVSMVVGNQVTAGDPGELWQLRTEDGNVYGPVSRAELDRWASEGRVTPNSQLTKAGLDQWLVASAMYPWLLQRAAAVNPFADQAGRSPNPYAAPKSPGTQYLTPHRGGLILTLGILSILICNLLAPFAWVMGSGDLKKMRAGTMDPGGHGQTQAGMILGIVGCVLMVLICGFYLLLGIASVANH